MYALVINDTITISNSRRRASSFLVVTHQSTNQNRRCLTSGNEPLNYNLSVAKPNSKPLIGTIDI